MTSGIRTGLVKQAVEIPRPEVDCIMFTRYHAFCAVCRRAIERVIGMYTG